MAGDMWDKEFAITSVTRADLLRAGARRALVRALTDTQMRAIAKKMGEYYVVSESGQFWEHVQLATEYVLSSSQPQRNATPTPPAGSAGGTPPVPPATREGPGVT